MNLLTDLPLNRHGFSHYKDFCHLLPFKRTTMYKWIKEGKFPAPAIMNTNFTVWKNSEILAWIENPQY